MVGVGVWFYGRYPPSEVTFLLGFGCGWGGVLGVGCPGGADGRTVEAGQAEHKGGRETRQLGLLALQLTAGWRGFESCVDVFFLLILTVLTVLVTPRYHLSF